MEQSLEMGQDGLSKLLEEHARMRNEIQNLRLSLTQCELKWNKIVKTTLRENVDLKAENRKIKEELKRLQTTNDLSA